MTDLYQVLIIASGVIAYLFKAERTAGQVVAQLRAIHESLDRVVSKIDNHETRISKIEGSK